MTKLEDKLIASVKKTEPVKNVAKKKTQETKASVSSKKPTTVKPKANTKSKSANKAINKSATQQRVWPD